jgi:ankyrin repeat protein
MMEHGADIHLPNADGRTALHIAAADGNISMAHFLINAGAPLAVKDRWGITPFAEAIRSESYDVALVVEAAESTQSRKALEKEYELANYAPNADVVSSQVMAPLQRKVSKLASFFGALPEAQTTISPPESRKFRMRAADDVRMQQHR